MAQNCNRFYSWSVTSPDAISAAVERLADALETRVPCAAVRDLIGTDDLPAAYAVQQGLVQKRLALGATVVGRKIGATSKAVQDQLGVDQPDFGYLLSEMDVSDETASSGGISMRRLVQPRVEAEVAFILGRDLDLAEDDLTIEAVRAAVDVALPALEIVDSRIEGWDIEFTDTVADNASSGLYVVGTEGKSLDELEPKGVEMSLTINGEVRSSGNGAPRASATRSRPCGGWLCRQAASATRCGPVTSCCPGVGPIRALRTRRQGQQGRNAEC